jgi:hypothetical protein
VTIANHIATLCLVSKATDEKALSPRLVSLSQERKRETKQMALAEGSRWAATSIEAHTVRARRMSVRTKTTAPQRRPARDVTMMEADPMRPQRMAGRPKREANSGIRSSGGQTKVVARSDPNRGPRDVALVDADVTGSRVTVPRQRSVRPRRRGVDQPKEEAEIAQPRVEANDWICCDRMPPT